MKSHYSTYDDDEDEGDSDGSTSNTPHWKEGMAKKAAKAFLSREEGQMNLQEFVYGKSSSSGNTNIYGDNSDSDSDDGDSDSSEDFFRIKKSLGGGGGDDSDSDDNDGERVNDSSKPASSNFDTSLVESLRNKFVTGDWSAANKPTCNDDGDDVEEFGAFEDLETGERFGPGADGDDSGSDNDSDGDDGGDEMTDEQLREQARGLY